MNKLLSPLPGGGFPLTNEDLLNLQNELYHTVQALAAGVGDSFVVSGCELGISTSTTCTVSPGYVYLAGEYRYFSGYTGTYPFYIVPAPDAVSTRRYYNGAVQNSYVLKAAQASATQAPGGVGIGFNPDTIQRLVKKITGAEATARQLADQNIISGLQDEAAARIDAFNALSDTAADLQAQVNQKQSRVKSFIPWTNLTLEPDFSTLAAGGAVKTAQFMRTEDGFVHLRGGLTTPVLTGGNATAARFPVGVGLLGNSYHTVFSRFATPAVTAYLVVAGGSISVYDASGATNSQFSFALDGVSFFSDLS